jgi:hypothetical protein
MDEQFSTCMAWIWSCMCLTLLCTSTQSSNLKWASEGGINSLRSPKSRWLKAVETFTIGWTNAPLFIGVGSSGAPPRHIAIANLTDTIHSTLHPTVCWFIRCWRLRSQNLSVSKYIVVGWTTAWSVGSSGATSRCTSASPSCVSEPPDRLTTPSNGPSVHLTPSSSLLLLWQFIWRM